MTAAHFVVGKLRVQRIHHLHMQQGCNGLTTGRQRTHDSYTCCCGKVHFNPHHPLSNDTIPWTQGVLKKCLEPISNQCTTRHVVCRAVSATAAGAAGNAATLLNMCTSCSATCAIAELWLSIRQLPNSAWQPALTLCAAIGSLQEVAVDHAAGQQETASKHTEVRDSTVRLHSTVSSHLELHISQPSLCCQLRAALHLFV
jgi:hypothetical protein